MLRLDSASIHDNRLVVVILHKLLHLGWQIGETVASDSMAVHGFGEGDEVWIDHLSMRVSLFVEQVCHTISCIKS